MVAGLDGPLPSTGASARIDRARPGPLSTDAAIADVVMVGADHPQRSYAPMHLASRRAASNGASPRCHRWQLSVAASTSTGRHRSSPQHPSTHAPSSRVPRPIRCGWRRRTGGHGHHRRRERVEPAAALQALRSRLPSRPVRRRTPVARELVAADRLDELCLSIHR